MADINQVITLGIGTPAGITEFLTLGLQFPDVSDLPDVMNIDFSEKAPDITFEVVE